MLNQNLIDNVRDYIYDKITTGKIGSDGSEVSLFDTDLGSEISGSSATITKTKFTNGVSFSYTSPDSLTGTIREFGLFDSSDELELRAVMPEIELDSGSNINIDTQILLIQELVE